MTVIYDFTCAACGLTTPGAAEIPDTSPPSQPIVLAHECHHCEEPLEKSFASISELLSSDNTTMRE